MKVRHLMLLMTTIGFASFTNIAKEKNNLEIINTEKAEHYIWGEKAHGWHFLQRDDLSIIREKVPPGVSEVMHYHNIFRQFFYILSGQASIKTTETIFELKEDEGIEIPPRAWHQFINDSKDDVEILVISMPKSHGDKYTIKKLER